MPLPVESFPPRFLFAYLMYFYYSVHQSIWNRYQVAHGNISINTIFIGDTKYPGTRGFLINLENSTVRLFLLKETEDRSFSLFKTPNGDPRFQSAAAISKDIFPSSKFPPVDYFDDLESFYYVLAHICIAFTKLHTLHPNLPYNVSVWAINSRFEKSNLTKTAIISGSGVEHGHVQPYFGRFIFSALLEDLHTIFKAFSSWPVTKEMIRKDSDEDYEDFLERPDWAIGVIEDFEDGQLDEIDTQMATFKLDKQ